MRALETIVFGKYKVSKGDTLILSDTMKQVKVLEITDDQGRIFVLLRYGNGNPQLVPAENLAYYMVHNIYQPASKAMYKVGQRFIHQYNNNTVQILGASPGVTADKKEYVYFCILTDERGSFNYIAVEESYFERLVPIKPKDDVLPLPEIPDYAVKPEVRFFYEPHHGHHEHHHNPYPPPYSPPKPPCPPPPLPPKPPCPPPPPQKPRYIGGLSMNEVENGESLGFLGLEKCAPAPKPPVITPEGFKSDPGFIYMQSLTGENMGYLDLDVLPHQNGKPSNNGHCPPGLPDLTFVTLEDAEKCGEQIGVIDVNKKYPGC